MRITLLLILSFFSISSFSQNEIESNRDFTLTENKGKFFFYWGYNRTKYGKSDITWKGPGYDFTLSDVEATDLPKEFSSVYYNPAKLTIPQFNLRLGYFINDKYAVAAGWDHMKYRSLHGSIATFKGNIGADVSPTYSSLTDGEKVRIDNDSFVRMEHSDGFNVLNLNVERHDLLWSFKDDKIALKLVSGAGLGIAMPWTNSRVFEKTNDDRIHFSGIGAQFFLAPEVLFFKRIFVRATGQFGFANMWDIAITPRTDKSDTHAEQVIYYFERSVVVGYNFKIFK
ncbi:MAG: hypothetical protein JKY48_09300 [Flavobacteriales bacterium]|nr:hypothetical protein [Flavobacteriales bacterium]